ncbi:MAG TPA: DUF488 domain-containing protein [Bacteroidia bacterium]|jgi:uncharacterized protein (DUF488 family)|nr:DUF488 domain-containing protein [Bacteroidia bacterium]
MNHIINKKIIFTIGHSDHTVEKFINLLKKHLVTVLADVRTVPFSRIHPQFNKDYLSIILEKENIKYVFLGKELGARPDNLSCYKNGQVDFELIAETNEFKAGLERLIKGCDNYRIAIMCAEKEPLDCHRTILVCHHLAKHSSMNIMHILADGQLENHCETESRLIKITDSERTLFDREISDSERMEKAYKKREREIAHKKESKDKNYDEF